MVPLGRQIAAVRAEIVMRHRVYARFVRDKRMSQERADICIAEMEAVLATLLELDRMRRENIQPTLI